MRVPALGRPLALAIAVLAVASACKKNPVAPEEPRERGEPQPSAQAMMGAGEARSDGLLRFIDDGDGSAFKLCSPDGVVNWRGLRHAPAGKASLTVVDDASPLLVGGVGHSGRDGVCSAAPDGAVGLSQAWRLGGIDGLVVRDQWENGAHGTFGTAAVMIPDGNTLLLGIVHPQLLHAGCPMATVELLRGGSVVDQRSISCERQGKLRGVYVLGTIRPLGPMTPSIVRGYLGARFQYEVQGMVIGFAWWGAEESGIADRVSFTAPVSSPATLRRSIVTAAGAPGGGTMLIEGFDYLDDPNGN